MRRAISLTVLLVACGGPQASPEPVPVPESDSDSDSDPESESASRQPPPDPASRQPPADPASRQPPPASASASASAATSDAYLAAHNAYRAKHCAPPLTWSAELATVAQRWADELKQAGCAFEHSRTRYGENLAGGTSGALDPAGSTEMWYREVDQYDFRKGGFSMATGHFTQVVWAGTQRLGCGMTTCKGLDIIVCNYDPPGNVQGQYAANVKPTGCK